MKISLVLIVYNGEESLEDCLRSILLVKYPKDKMEVIIVDDASSDGTRIMLDKYERLFEEAKIKLSIILSKNNEGRIKARIKGVSKAAYKRVMLVDVQMRIESDALKKISNYNNLFHLITNLTMDKYKNIDSTILYLLRNRYYSPYWGKEFFNY